MASGTARCWSLLPVVLAVLGSASSRPGGCVYRKIGGHALVTGNRDELQNQPLAECEYVCTAKERRCNSFNYYPDKRLCQLNQAKREGAAHQFMTEEGSDYWEKDCGGPDVHDQMVADQGHYQPPPPPPRPAPAEIDHQPGEHQQDPQEEEEEYYDYDTDFGGGGPQPGDMDHHAAAAPRPPPPGAACPGFRCLAGGCVRDEYRCDGEVDCHDGSDEANCPATTPDPRFLHNGYFKCRNGKEVPARWFCDGEDDCGDLSDEWDCKRPKYYG